MQFKRQTFFIAIFAFLFHFNDALSCGIDVTILEGDTIEMCQDAIVDLNASSGYVNYTWYGAGAGNAQFVTPVNAGWYYVDAEDGVACISTDSIFVIINATPVSTILSSEGTSICPPIAGTTLSVDIAGTDYLWSTGDNSPTLFVTNGGTYDVDVTDVNGCIGNASLLIEFVQFNLAAIGSGAVCSGSSVALQASGGDAYSWSTGEFGPVIVVAPTVETTYSVTIFKGACTATLSETVEVLPAVVYEMEDVVYVFPGQTEYVEGPSGFDDYIWTPSNIVSSTGSISTGFVGSQTEYVFLSASVDGGCTISDSVLFVVVNLTIPEGFSPNNDGINDFFTIPELSSDSLTAKLKVWNRWGDVVYNSDFYKNDWDGTCKSSLCVGNSDLPEGTYYYILRIDAVEFEGMITLKR